LLRHAAAVFPERDVANEITVTAAISCFKPSIMGSVIGRFVNGLQFNMTGNYYSEGVMTVQVSATPIPMGNVSQPHWAFFRNMDAVNSVTIRNGATGADLAQYLAGEASPLPLLSTCTPYAIASGVLLLEYLILSL
jgi:hypothetical protein